MASGNSRFRSPLRSRASDARLRSPWKYRTRVRGRLTALLRAAIRRLNRKAAKQRAKRAKLRARAAASTSEFVPLAA